MSIAKTGNYSDEKFNFRKKWVGFLRQQNRAVGDNIPNAVFESIVDEIQYFRMALIGRGGVPVRPKNDGTAIIIEPWFRIKQGSTTQSNNFIITGPYDAAIDSAIIGTAIPTQSRARYIAMGLVGVLDATVEYADSNLSTEPYIHSQLSGVDTTGAVGTHKIIDSAADFTYGTAVVNQLVNRTVTDLTTGNTFIVTANTATTITVSTTLLGDVAVAGDVYRVDIVAPSSSQTDQIFLNLSLEEVDRVLDSNIMYTVGGSSQELERPIRVKQFIEFYQRSLSGSPPTISNEQIQTYTDSLGNIHFRALLANVARTASLSTILNADITDKRNQYLRGDIGNQINGTNEAKGVLEAIWFADTPGSSRPFLCGPILVQEGLDNATGTIVAGQTFLHSSALMQQAIDNGSDDLSAGEGVLVGDQGFQDALDNASPDPDSANPFATLENVTPQVRFVVSLNYDGSVTTAGQASSSNLHMLCGKLTSGTGNTITAASGINLLKSGSIYDAKLKRASITNPHAAPGGGTDQDVKYAIYKNGGLVYESGLLTTESINYLEANDGSEFSSIIYSPTDRLQVAITLTQNTLSAVSVYNVLLEFDMQ